MIKLAPSLYRFRHFLMKPYRRFGEEVSAQDAFKALALLIMVIDHVGSFCFPEIPLLRAIGRAGLPIWFFFVGYNFKEKPHATLRLFLIALAFEMACHLLGKDSFQLNVLFTMALCRVVLARYAHSGKELSLAMWGAATVVATISYGWLNECIEYGLLSMLMALWGYHCRLKKGDQKMQTLFVSVAIAHSTVKCNFLGSSMCEFEEGLQW